MQHVIITDYGRSLGVTHQRLVIREGDSLLKEIPLRKISTINIQKKGVSISSNLLSACGRYGIRFFIGNRAKELYSLQGNSQHAVVQNRINQYNFLADEKQRHRISRAFIYGKLKNQRATILYFSKQKCSIEQKHNSEMLAIQLLNLANKVRNLPLSVDWLHRLMGLEGQGAKLYWQFLSLSKLLGENFNGRTGRGAVDSANQALNYGYGILSSVIWNCLSNAGLEVYLGALHVVRAGRPALVLDLMEEFRPWIVDRSVIKLRSQLQSGSLTEKTRKKLAQSILSSLEKTIYYKGKKVRLESVIQRQCYRLSGLFSGDQEYRPVLFRW